MASSFSHLRALFGQPSPAPERQQTRADREAARAQSRQDIADGRRMFLEQQSRQADADPEAQREAFYKAQALKIVNAGLRARGMPLRTCLIQDEPFQPLFDQTPSEEYPPDSNGPSKDPDDADDSPVDDRKDKTKKSKKSKKVQEDDEDAEEKDESDGDTDTNPDKQKSGAANPQPGETIDQYWQRVRSTARAITRAGDRRRGLIR